MTIRKRLLLLLALLLLLVFGAAGIASYLEGRHEVEELFDAQLATSARVLSSLLDRRLDERAPEQPALQLQQQLGSPQPSDTLGWLDFGEATDLGHKYEKKLAFQVWHRDGWLLAQSASAPATALAPLSPGYTTVRHIDGSGHGHYWRVFTLRSNGHVYQVGERDDVRGELATYIAWQSVAVLVVVMPLLLLIVSFVLHRGLRPLELLAQALQQRGPQALTPLVVKNLPGELAAITGSINSLFERLERAFQRERQFTGNAAHELRTPLAALAIHAENALTATSDEDLAHSLRQMQAGLGRTTRVVEQLLALSRLEPMAASGDWHPLPLAELARQVVEQQQQLAPATIDCQLDDQARVSGNHTLLQLALRNLLDNAVRYGGTDQLIRVCVRRSGSWVEAEVCDQGPGIPPALRQRVIEPFVRGEGHLQPGSGLGLAIVKQVAELHHGQLLLDGNHQAASGLCVVLRLPAA